MASLQASGRPCTPHAPEPLRQVYHQNIQVSSVVESMPASVCISHPSRITVLRSRPFNTTPDMVIGLAVSPSREIVFHVRISALEVKHANEFLILPKRFAIVSPARCRIVRMLRPSRLPITPNRSLRLTSVLFCDEDVGAFVGEDVFPSAPPTSRLIVRPYKLPSGVLSPRADWPFRPSTGTPR